jgi:hypothetical protein
MSRPRKAAPKKKLGAKSKATRRRPVLINRPASPERSEEIFGISSSRSKDIKGLIEEIVSEG